MKQPDAFERAGLELLNKVNQNNLFVSSAMIATLLRRHHAKIERMVREELAIYGTYGEPHLQSILTKLQAMRRGK